MLFFGDIMNLGRMHHNPPKKGKRLGYFVNCLSKLRKTLREKGYKISKAQIRLIMKDLSNIDKFEEMEFDRQKRSLCQWYLKYVRVSRYTMELMFSQTMDQRKGR